LDEILETQSVDDEEDEDGGLDDAIDTSESEEDEEYGAFNEDALPNRMICPITQRLMKHPVICTDGNTYEQKAIRRWFGKHATSPMTNLPIERTMIPNRALREEIEELQARHAEGQVGGAGVTSGGGAGGASTERVSVAAIEERKVLAGAEGEGGQAPTTPVESATGTGTAAGGGTGMAALPPALETFFRNLGLQPSHMAAVQPLIEAVGATEPSELADLSAHDASSAGKECVAAITSALPLAKQKKFRDALKDMVDPTPEFCNPPSNANDDAKNSWLV
jgi:hypothetical protein